MYQIAYKFKHLFNKKSKVERNTCVCFVCLLKVQFIKLNTCDKDSKLCIKNKYQSNEE